MPVLLGERIPRSDRGAAEKEAWARMMLILFVPWRHPSDLKSSTESWLAAFERQRNHITSRHLQIIENMNVLSECRDVRDAHRDLRRSEVLKFMSMGLPVEGNQHSGRNLDEDIGNDYQLFDKSYGENVYEELESGETSRISLDNAVGMQTRQVLDACYSDISRSLLGQIVADRENTRVRLRQEDDAPTLLNHQAIMRHLKRQRRPEGGEDATQRPSKRRRLPAVEESVSVSTLRRDSAPAEVGVDIPVSISEAIEKVAAEMHLGDNPEQDRAFRIVAEHARNPDGNDQLLMYIAGVGGTGKTHIVNAVLRLFALLGRSNEIMVGAPTGAAALNIGGYTIHSLVMLPSTSKQIMQQLRELWSPVKYFVIDEVSMIGARFLADISRRLQLAKGDTGAAAVNPFGGVNVIFTGDFGQLKPVEGPCLYNSQYINHPNLQAIRGDTGVDKLKGIFLWRQVETIVHLTKNQRQASDPQYAAMLDRVRVGGGRAKHCVETGEISDLDLLLRHTLMNVAQEDPELLREFQEAPVIVGTRALRDIINARIIKHKSAEAGQKVTRLYSRDRVARKPVPKTLRDGLWKLPSSKTDDSLGILPIFPGMKVMIRENIAFSRKLVNGAEGTVQSIVHEVVDGVAYATVAYVHVPGAGRVSDELEEDIVPVFPERAHFKCAMSVNGRKIVKQVSRLQLPLVPAYAYTDYKSQGKTLTHAIVDLQSAMSLQGAYVMLSRVRSLRGLMLLRPFGASKVCGRLSQELRDEFRRISRLDQATKARFEARTGRNTSEY